MYRKKDRTQQHTHRLMQFVEERNENRSTHKEVMNDQRERLKETIRVCLDWWYGMEWSDN